MRRRVAVGASLVVVAAYGGLLGMFVWNIYVGYVPPPHRLSWRAPWMVHPGPEIPQSYFRKKVYLGEAPRRAWVKVIAPDQFQLYVNGQLVSQLQEIERNVSGVYDITPLIKPGTNLIAVGAFLATHPGNSRMALEGEYEDRLGNVKPIPADGTWKVARYRERQPDGGPLWYEEAFIDDAWKKAETRGVPGPKDHSKVPYHPWIFTARLEGQWISSQAATADKAHVRYPLALPSGVREAWIRIATREGYALLVNGVQIAEQPGPSDAALPAPSLNVDMFDITRFLRSGSNVLAIKVYTQRADRRLYADALIVEPSGRERLLATPAGWQTAVSSPRADWAAPAYNAAGWGPTAAVGRILPEDGPMPRQIVDIYPPEAYQLSILVKWSGFLLLGALAAIGLWLLVARALLRQGDQLSDALTRGTTAFALAGGVLVGAWLLGYDIRFDLSFPFQLRIILGSLGLLLLLQIVLAFLRPPAPSSESGGAETASGPAESEPGRDEVVDPPVTPWRRASRFGVRRRYALFVVAVTVLGLGLRLHDLTYEPIGPDEASGMLATSGIFKYGYPTYQISNLIDARVTHSSELEAYAKVPTVWLFGENEVGARLPGTIFGLLTIPLIFVLGRRLFDRRVGAVAALIFAILPAGISFAHYARYPSQLAFFTLLSVYLFYRGVAAEKIRMGFLYWGVVSFAIAYLTWEAVAFLLPGLMAGLLAVKRRDFRWLKEKHLWFALIAAGLVIYFQLSARIIDQSDRMSLGSGLADISILPLWLYAGYDPLVYFHSFFFTKNLQIVSALMLLGIVFCLPDRRFAFLNATFVIPMFLTTNLLETQEFRHVYYTLPLVLLSGVKTLFVLLDWMLPLGTEASAGRTADGMRRMARWALVGLVLLTVNDYGLKLYNLPGYYGPATSWLWLGDGDSMKGAVAFIRQHSPPGAPVIAREPNWVYFHMRSVDQFIKTEGDLPAAVADKLPIPVHRKSGVPLVSNVYALRQTLNKYPSAWIVSNSTLGGLDPDSRDFINTKTPLVYENRQVAVYRWTR